MDNQYTYKESYNPTENVDRKTKTREGSPRDSYSAVPTYASSLSYNVGARLFLGLGWLVASTG